MVATLAKGIKPQKLRVDRVRLNLLNALRAEGRAVAAEFRKTTASWEGEKPDFDILISLTGDSATVVVGPTGSDLGAKKWDWLNRGTPPHKIKAKTKPRLIYRTGYAPKTKVGTLASYPGGSFGEYRSWPEVDHPGTEARGWSELIEKRRRKVFTQSIVKAARIVY